MLKKKFSLSSLSQTHLLFVDSYTYRTSTPGEMEAVVTHSPSSHPTNLLGRFTDSKKGEAVCEEVMNLTSLTLTKESKINWAWE
jgi:hypothetical protein